MTNPRNLRGLLFASILALGLTVGGTVAVGYRYLSTRATRWGDSLIVGPRFSGDVSLDGGATQVHVAWENGSPVLDAPIWKGAGTIYVTFIWGFAVFTLPPGTAAVGKRTAR